MFTTAEPMPRIGAEIRSDSDLAERRSGTSKPEELAAACAFLVSDDTGLMTGQTINMNGGRFLGN